MERVTNPETDQPIQNIERPDRALWNYYLLSALAVPPFFPFVALFLWFRYHTMRYKFTSDGISMSWGILFRREVIVNYARIQDIHLQSNVVERWLGLARVMIQTASGSSSAEMTIEGLKEFEAVRDFLYARMRGVKDIHAHPSEAPAALIMSRNATRDDELVTALRETTGELRAIRELLAQRNAAKSENSPHV